MTGAQGDRWPDFFLVGHHKSGTTAMYEMLRRHPRVFMPDLKEPRYMADDLRWRGPPGLPGSRNPVTAESYLALFAAAGADQLLGEASATYLFSSTAAERIAEVQPGAKIIAILREPVQFLRSLHTQYLGIQFEQEPDLARAIAMQPARREGKRLPPRAFIPELLQYTDQVRYTEQLERFEQRFGRENMLVLIYDDFRRDNRAELLRVLGFLGLEGDPALTPVEANVTTHTVRYPRLDVALDSAVLGRGAAWGFTRAAAKTLTSQRLRMAMLRTVRRRFMLREPTQLRAELTQELRERFRPEVVAVSEHLGRDLVSLWGYDSSA